MKTFKTIIFDIVMHNNEKIYLDKKINLIFNKDAVIIGIIHNKNYLFFDDLNHILTKDKINTIKI